MRNEFNRGIYDTLDEFIKEYSLIEDETTEKSRGMDFIYKNKKYRMCREYDEVFYIYSVNDNSKVEDSFNILGICNSMNELLTSTYILNIPFKEIVMDEINTIIFGKD